MRQNRTLTDLDDRHAAVVFPTDGNGRFHTYRGLLNEWAEANGLPPFEYDPESRTFEGYWTSTLHVRALLPSLDSIGAREADYLRIGAVTFACGVTFDPAAPAVEEVKRLIAEHARWTAEVKAAGRLLRDAWLAEIVAAVQARAAAT